MELSHFERLETLIGQRVRVEQIEDPQVVEGTLQGGNDFYWVDDEHGRGSVLFGAGNIANIDENDIITLDQESPDELLGET